MRGDQNFFELPIYFEPKDTYDERFSRLLEARAQEAWQRTADPRKDLDWHRRRVERSYSLCLARYGGEWAYNQICGFLGIYPLGDQLRGTTWYSQNKLVRRTTARKDIREHKQAFELTVYPSQDSREIFMALLAKIQWLRRQPPYKRRFLDTRPLELAGRFLDWRRLMDFSTSCSHGVRVEELPDLLLAPLDHLGTSRQERTRE